MLCLALASLLAFIVRKDRTRIFIFNFIYNYKRELCTNHLRQQVKDAFDIKRRCVVFTYFCRHGILSVKLRGQKSALAQILVCKMVSNEGSL